MYPCVLSCLRLRQGTRDITGFGQEFVLPTNEQAHDLAAADAEAERLQRLEQPHWVRPVALNWERCGTATRKHLSITGATRPMRSSCRSHGQTSK